MKKLAVIFSKGVGRREVGRLFLKYLKIAMFSDFKNILTSNERARRHLKREAPFHWAERHAVWGGKFKVTYGIMMEGFGTKMMG